LAILRDELKEGSFVRQQNWQRFCRRDDASRLLLKPETIVSVPSFTFVQRMTDKVDHIVHGILLGEGFVGEGAPSHASGSALCIFGTLTFTISDFASP
jgi:hypothetical protein